MFRRVQKRYCVNRKSAELRTDSVLCPVFDFHRPRPEKMLRRELQEVAALVLTVVDLGVGLHCPGGGEGPAAAAHALVPHGVDDALLPPVHGGREVLQPQVRPRSLVGGVGDSKQGTPETTRVGGDKFLS